MTERVVFFTGRTLGKSWALAALREALDEKAREALRVAYEKAPFSVIHDEAPTIPELRVVVPPKPVNQPHGPQKHRKGKVRRW